MNSTHESQAVSIVGTGAIGTAVARALLEAGCPVTVWNRSEDRARPAIQAGAGLAASAADAALASPLTLVVMTDYDAVRAILDSIDTDLSGRTIVVLCTGTPDDAQSAADRTARINADYLDAGVQTAPEDIGTPTATIFYGGENAVFERHRPVLELLSTPVHVGTEPTAAAICDLALFGVWYDAQLGLLRALDTVAGAGVDLSAFAEAAATQVGHVSAAAANTAAEVERAEYPRGPASLTEHLTVLDQLVELRAKDKLGDGGLPHVRRLVAALADAGRGEEGLTAVLRSFPTTPPTPTGTPPDDAEQDR